MGVKPLARTSEPESEIPSSVTVHGFVEMPIADVFARFQDPGIDGLLTSVVRHVLRDGVAELTVHAWPTVWIASQTVRVPLEWRLRMVTGEVVEGSATVSLLTVQSGRDAITEILVVVPAPEADDGETRAVVREVLGELTRRLAVTS